MLMLVGLLSLPLAAQSLQDALQGILLGESGSCSRRPHLPHAAELCWPRPHPCRWSCCRLWAQEPRSHSGRCCGRAAWSLRSVIGSLQRRRQLPPRPVLSWEAAAPLLPAALAAHGQPGHRTAVPWTPRVCWTCTASSGSTEIHISICPCCFSARAPPVLRGNSGASPGCRICGQFLEMSVYVGQFLWGIFVACSLFPTIPPFFFPQKHLKAVQFCNWNVLWLREFLGMQRAGLWPADRLSPQG